MKIISLSNLPEEGVSHNPEIKKKVILKVGEVPHLVSLSQACLKPGQVVGYHAHDDVYEIFLVERGKGIFCVGKNEYQIEKGVCITVEPGEVHDIKNISSSDLVLNYFTVKK